MALIMGPGPHCSTSVSGPGGGSCCLMMSCVVDQAPGKRSVDARCTPGGKREKATPVVGEVGRGWRCAKPPPSLMLQVRNHALPLTVVMKPEPMLQPVAGGVLSTW